ncbi:MAG: glycosyltransferase family protein [Melioribacteraceae bacterium]|nr:glycosyltransferase family protein [Melioribacteraceae bacterium]MCF8263286.1 glycosyltransferase family protein [Melioribacteraceae bacterium]MCF8412972.1 glycosyltransferase family protein [Melioribacteraceae bacterium]MCF8432416.1 glycosyltransferase family protein [Melioribacteraceae bacterium]
MNDSNIVTVIQARVGSSRLPNKVMLSLCGKPLLFRMYERVKAATLSGTVVIATSKEKEDDKIEEFCLESNILCYRGDINDLLDRHYQVGLNFNADAVVKIPSDCPLIDPRIIDKVIKYYLVNRDKFDFVSNLHPPSYPDGNDVEIMSMSALTKAWENATRKLEREHTTPFIWENPDKFRIGNVLWETGLDYSTTYRWTIDYEKDYIFIRSVYEELFPSNKNFSMYSIINLIKEKPYLGMINEEYLGNYWYENHLDELTNIAEFKQKRIRTVNDY